MKGSRRDFIKTAALAAAASGWHRPAWSATPVWAPPPVRKLKVIENTWIPMPDGIELAAPLAMDLSKRT